jgi:hypothetical protein
MGLGMVNSLLAQWSDGRYACCMSTLREIFLPGVWKKDLPNSHGDFWNTHVRVSNKGACKILGSQVASWLQM